MENLAWSNGIKAERSRKEDNPALRQNISTEENTNRENLDKKSKNDMTIEQEQIKGDYTLTRNTFRKTSNRRESSNNKLSERYMVSRACGNPFLTHLNYTDDILTQEQFLIPKNSNMENEYNE